MTHGIADITNALDDMKLTIEQAAELLHVSRPHIIKLLEEGEISYTRTSDDPDSHCLILLRDALEYRERRHVMLRQLLRELAQDAEQAAGGYV